MSQLDHRIRRQSSPYTRSHPVQLQQLTVKVKTASVHLYWQTHRNYYHYHYYVLPCHYVITKSARCAVPNPWRRTFVLGLFDRSITLIWRDIKSCAVSRDLNLFIQRRCSPPRKWRFFDMLCWFVRKPFEVSNYFNGQISNFQFQLEIWVLGMGFQMPPKLASNVAHSPHLGSKTWKVLQSLLEDK